jgi:hypothetical protein
MILGVSVWHKSPIAVFSGKSLGFPGYPAKLELREAWTQADVPAGFHHH